VLPAQVLHGHARVGVTQATIWASVNRFFIVRSFPVDRTLNRNATQNREDVGTSERRSDLRHEAGSRLDEAGVPMSLTRMAAGPVARDGARGA